MDRIKAIVQRVVPEGRHGPFAVATSDQLEGSVTFSLEPTVWKESERPEEGTVVYLSKIQQKRAGWRAKEGRFWKPSDEQVQQGAKSKVEFDKIEGVVTIAGSLYVKTPEALETLLGQLREIGYKIDNLRDTDYRKRDGVSVETMEKNGWSLWFVHLDLRRAKCGSCGQIIDVCGVQAHGHKCELCGEVTYYNIIDGSTVRFSFIDRELQEPPLADLTMKAKRWDVEEGYLYLYPEVLDGLWLRGERAKQYFEENSDKWEAVKEDGQDLIRVKYPQPWDYNVAAISPSDIYGNHWNHKIVLIWDGKEYPEYSHDLPVPQSISIYEAWHWMPLAPSPHLHEKLIHVVGQVADAGFYHQDGRPAWSGWTYAEIGKFIRHFTNLDADKWDEQSKHFRLDGPGGIADVAGFCHKDAVVVNEPNVGNLLVGFGKALSGESLTEGEKDAMAVAASDPEERDKFLGTFKAPSDS